MTISIILFPIPTLHNRVPYSVRATEEITREVRTGKLGTQFKQGKPSYEIQIKKN